MKRQKVTYEQYVRIQQVREARAQIPTDKLLAAELGLSPHTVCNAMHGRQKRHYARYVRERAVRR